MKRLLLYLGLMGGFVLCDCGCVSAAQTIDTDQALDLAYGILDEVFWSEKAAHSQVFQLDSPDFEKRKEEMQAQIKLDFDGKTILTRAVELENVDKVKNILECIVFSSRDPYEAIETIIGADPSRTAASYFRETPANGSKGNAEGTGIRDISKNESVALLITGTVLMLRFGLYNADCAIAERQIYRQFCLPFSIDEWRNGIPDSVFATLRNIATRGIFDYPPLDSRLDDQILQFLMSASGDIKKNAQLWECISLYVLPLIAKDKIKKIDDISDEKNEKSFWSRLNFFGKAE